ncbi:uncharacterized protein LOC111711072 isoform X2 [Eurytemora carolleeae]|uniref:uncharacterized protein LOC111711072 isoform X2 n=1 Tax=Eurytemora carolleeae TaxID=1294199 RepID=UPI000C77E663|nr:uncharacterized protein LOC111711072 isoform X2 [Eurytemora carolleeae]|eukprot:XP_023341089.1 uncharacterized protein LOC111711072 isoform X2 [Eurytemora affinis]
MKYLVIALCVGTTLARPDGAGGHHHDHSAAAAPAPSSGYQEPAAGYSAPASGYEQPAYDSGAGYAPSAGGYDAGYDTGYTAPESYAPAPYGTTDTGPFLGFGLGWVWVPIVIVLGLFLLFPSTTVVPVTNGRRKRGAEEEVSGNSIVERIQDITMAVLESEECMERVACEIGGIISDAGISKKVFTAAEAYVPSKYSKLMKTFNSPKDCHKNKCGSMF